MRRMKWCHGSWVTKDDPFPSLPRLVVSDVKSAQQGQCYRLRRSVVTVRLKCATQLGLYTRIFGKTLSPTVCHAPSHHSNVTSKQSIGGGRRHRHYFIFRIVRPCVLPCVRPSVRPGVQPVSSTISYKPMDGILPNFGWRCRDLGRLSLRKP